MNTCKVSQITDKQKNDLLQVLEKRFNNNMHRHESIEWKHLETRLVDINISKLISLQMMEETGGEPDVIGYDKRRDGYIFIDCSKESPTGRRSLCYDKEALDARKTNKPKNNVINMIAVMGIQLLTEEQYRKLQEIGPFDTRTSSWLMTPTEIRALGGAIFGDFRYGRTFVYHNGAESYYSSRGFRGVLEV